MIFFFVGCSWAVPVGNIVPQFLQRFAACCRMRGPADVRNTYKVRVFSLEPARPAWSLHHTQLAGRLHTPHGPTRPALVDRAYQLYEGASGSFRWSAEFVRARSRGRSVRTASFCVLHAPPVWLYMCLRVPCVTRAARVSAMVRRHRTAIGYTKDNLYDYVTLYVIDAPVRN